MHHPETDPVLPVLPLGRRTAHLREECRTILTSMVGPRSRRDVVVAEGLVMHGTPIPIGVSATTRSMQRAKMLEEQGLPIQQSTGTLLLQLRSHAVEPPGMCGRNDDHFYALWGELTQRAGCLSKACCGQKIAPAIAGAVLASAAD